MHPVGCTSTHHDVTFEKLSFCSRGNLKDPPLSPHPIIKTLPLSVIWH